MALYNLLPAKWRPYAKAWVAALGTVLVALTIALPACPEWVTVAVNLLSALGVWATPNTDPAPAEPEPEPEPEP